MRALLRLSLAALLLLSAPALADDDEGEKKEEVEKPLKVIEEDFATMRKIQYLGALGGARTFFDRANAARYDAETKKAIKDIGWTTQHFDEVRSKLSDVQQTISGYESKEMEKADHDERMASYDKTTIATAKAHLKEIFNNDDTERAEEQVRAERSESRKGTAPTVAALQGSWVIDVDASMERILRGAAGGDAVAMLRQQLGGNGYQFGPGDAITATAKNPDGTVKVEKGTFRLDGRTIYFKATGSKREQQLEAGMDPKGRLILGGGMMGMLYKKK